MPQKSDLLMGFEAGSQMGSRIARDTMAVNESRLRQDIAKQRLEKKSGRRGGGGRGRRRGKSSESNQLKKYGMSGFGGGTKNGLPQPIAAPLNPNHPGNAELMKYNQQFAPPAAGPAPENPPQKLPPGTKMKIKTGADGKMVAEYSLNPQSIQDIEFANQWMADANTSSETMSLNSDLTMAGPKPELPQELTAPESKEDQHKRLGKEIDELRASREHGHGWEMAAGEHFLPDFLDRGLFTTPRSTQIRNKELERSKLSTEMNLQGGGARPNPSALPAYMQALPKVKKGPNQ